MKRRGFWEWRTAKGTVAIVHNKTGRFYLELDGRTVGIYGRADIALDDAVEGTHVTLPSGLRTSDLAPPPSLSKWTFVRIDKRDLRDGAPPT